MSEYVCKDLFPEGWETGANHAIESAPENLISIIIPAYNICDELGSCLDSVLAQSHSQIEVIIVNDGSKDDTPAVMEYYAAKDRRIRTIHKENGGVTNARLAGVRAAKGHWIGFIDGDDRIEPDMYARLLENAKKYDADISHCGYQMVFPSRVDYYYNTGRITEQDHDTALCDLISGKFIEPGLWNKLFKRSLFRQLLEENPMDPTIRNLEDLLMNFYLFREANKSVHEDFCPYHYILRPDSASKGKINEHKLLDPLRVFKILRRETPDSSALQEHINVRIIQILTGHIAMSARENKALIRSNRKVAHKELLALLPAVRNSQVCSKKQYLMGLWAGYFPCSYRLVHRLYSKITGNDKKYEVK